MTKQPKASQDEIASRLASNPEHVWASGTWWHYSGIRWQRDADGSMDVIRTILDSAKTQMDSRWLDFWSGANQVSLILRKHRNIDPDAFDLQDQFNIINGTLKLDTMSLMKHDANDRITKLAPVVYDPDAIAPLWDASLTQWQPDPEIRAFIQRIIGYSMTRSTMEEMLFIFYGEGANGKSTFCEAISKVFGDYAAPAAPNVLLGATYERHPTEVADLMGRRLVWTNEPDMHAKLNESRVKDLQSHDKLKARWMKKDFFTFTPTHKIIMRTNIKPFVEGVEHGIWRRLCLIPWEQTIPADAKDKNIDAKLALEGSGILNWCLAGLRDYKARGLSIPDKVLAATEEYRALQNRIQQFIDDSIAFLPNTRTSSHDLYANYRAWCEQSGFKPLTISNFMIQFTQIAKGKATSYRTNQERGLDGVVIAKSYVEHRYVV